MLTCKSNFITMLCIIVKKYPDLFHEPVIKNIHLPGEQLIIRIRIFTRQGDLGVIIHEIAAN